MQATAVNRKIPGKQGSIDTPNPQSSGNDEPTDVIGQRGEKFAPKAALAGGHPAHARKNGDEIRHLYLLGTFSLLLGSRRWAATHGPKIKTVATDLFD
jgi:hypothetical protein